MDDRIRALTSADESILLTMLMYAAHESSVEIVRSNPALNRYVKDWGRSGDSGFVAIDECPVGAAWLRLFASNDRGFGYVDEGISELAIAVIPQYRGKGIGTKLLIQIIECGRNIYPAISLSVRADNPVVNLYQRSGFIKIDESEIIGRTGVTSFNMIYRFGRCQGVFNGIDRELLAWYDRTGTRYLMPEEVAQQERQRADRLAEQLRALGIDPDI
jgi:GNAT superfamily N-acetyltransferase